MKKPRYAWQPLVRADGFNPIRPELLAHTMQSMNLSATEARKLLDDDVAKCETWINDLYQVQKRCLEHDVVHLNIRRRDGAAMVRDWRHFQLIKNQLIGPECEAVELYPAESRLVDSCNKYHLYGSADPTYRFPFGWEERDVSYEEHRDVPGMRQRPA
jgi:hypothetical protein